ncbi:hypothetical protein [Aureliella helgolandensis]|uniref:Uncharacterized protein n=1 Tax=Aureliella helgolandensis TaxID=2527968 RepID=A0A518G8R4_9BACT|nr:hypothetical protein [Aureliella helgolandensis]QDV24986.1 hypothetical protein Q31a_33080 [Aureliella helgolandensis]
MNVSSNSTFVAVQAIGSEPHQQQDVAVARALQHSGVDDSRAVELLRQGEDYELIGSGLAPRGYADKSSILDSVHGLQASEEIDPARRELGVAAVREDSTPAARESETESQARQFELDSGGSIESALRATHMSEEEILELVPELLAKLTGQTSETDETSGAELEGDEFVFTSRREEAIRLLEESGIDLEEFRAALKGELGAPGSFLNLVV